MRRGSLALLLALVLAGMLAVPAAGAPEAPCTGTWEGSYDAPATFGLTGATWQPSALPVDVPHLQNLTELEITLTWSNTPAASAEFGIAVGTEERFRYWNQDFQSDFGEHRERLLLDAGIIAQEEWHTVDALSVGPSISTGQFGTQGIPYTITWSAQYAMSGTSDCYTDAEAAGAAGEANQGAQDDAGTGPSLPDGNLRGAPGMQLFLILLAVIAVAAVIATAAKAGRREHPDPEQER